MTEENAAFLSVKQKFEVLTCFACMCFNRWGQCGTILTVLMVEKLFGHNYHSSGNNKMMDCQYDIDSEYNSVNMFLLD